MSSSTRRDFLTATLATPVAGLLTMHGPAAAELPPIAAPPPPIAPSTIPPEPPKWFYADVQKVSDDKRAPRHVYGSRAEALTTRRFREGKPVIRRFEFIPLASEVRYFVANMKWAPAYPSSAIGERQYSSDATDAEKAAAKAAEDAAWELWRKDDHEYPPPAHTLALPPPSKKFPPPDINGEYYLDTDDVFTRENGFCEVSDFNERLLDAEEWELNEWACLVEIGQELPMPWFHLEIGATGIGAKEMHLVRPCRIIRPSDDEIDRLAVRYTWRVGAKAEAEEGGAA